MAQQQDSFEPDSFIPDSFEPEGDKGLLSSLREFAEGPTGQRIKQFLLGRETDEAGRPIVGMGSAPIFPEWNPQYDQRQDINDLKFFASGLYNLFLRPLSSAEGMIGSVTSMGPKPPAPVRGLLPPAKFIQGEAGTAIDVPYEVLGTGGAKNVIPGNLAARGETGFGMKPIASHGSTANLDELAEQARIANLSYGAEAQYPGTRLNVQDPTPPIPPVSGDTRLGFDPQTSGDLPYPLNVVPDQVRPRAAQTGIARQTGLETLERVTPQADSFIPDTEINFLSGAPEVTQLDEPLTYKAILDNATNQPPTQGAQTAGITNPQMPNAPKAPIDKPINLLTEPKQAVLNWTRGMAAAEWYGKNAAVPFSDLTDPSLIDKFQQGFRQGKLKDLQKAFDDLFEAETKLGIIDDDKYRENYLRQFWDYEKSSPEAIKIFNEGVIPKTARFAKDRTFETYAEGIAAGMVPKYNTIPEIYAARVAESYKAAKHKELYDYLLGNGWIKPTRAIHTPTAWEITGPKAKELQKYLRNYLSPNEGVTSFLGKAGSTVKNIYLSGGLPGTKYNMHLWNIARADIKLMGFGKGFKEAMMDPTGKRAAEWFNNTDKSLLPKLIEHGFQVNPVDDFLKTEITSGSLFDKTKHTVRDLFEKPLFMRALPVLKYKRATQIYEKLVKEMPEDAALDAASRIANQWYGGIEKSLRDKTGQNLARFFIIAPDWAEAKMRQALNEWKSTGKVLMGMGDQVDKVIAKSFGRGALFPAVGAAATAAIGNEVMGSPRETASIPLGGDMIFPTLTTADEATRLPVIAGSELMGGNPFAAMQIAGNRLNPAATIPWHLLTNRNYFGGRLYGGNIPAGQAMTNVAAELFSAAPLGIGAAFNMFRGDMTPEEAAAQALEAPIAFRK